jgi:RNA polymerase sigma-70 factor (ECF subfamily)
VNQQDSVHQEHVEQMRPYLLAIARLQIEQNLRAKIDASDIVQQTMLEAHRGIDNYRGTSPEQLRGWLRAILARNLADEVRKFRRGKRDAGVERSIENGLTHSSLAFDRFLVSPSTSPETAAQRNENLGKLAAAIDALPDDQRTAVTLHHLEGLSAIEIGLRMNRTDIAVAGLLRRGMKQLRQVLRDLPE